MYIFKHISCDTVAMKLHGCIADIKVKVVFLKTNIVQAKGPGLGS